MAGWSWPVIWVGLGLALLAVPALGAWWLFRKSLVLADDLAELAGTLAVLEVDDEAPAKPSLAVLAEPRDIQQREESRRFHRATRRRERHDRRLARARRITSVDATQQQWPSEWYPH